MRAQARRAGAWGRGDVVISAAQPTVRDGGCRALTMKLNVLAAAPYAAGGGTEADTGAAPASRGAHA